MLHAVGRDEQARRYAREAVRGPAAAAEALFHLDADALTPFVFEAAAVRGALVTLSETNRGVLASHRYPAPLARALPKP